MHRGRGLALASGPLDIGAFEHGVEACTPIFTDGFESGDTSNRSSTVPLEVAPAAPGGQRSPR